ncbi:DNA repair protein RadA [Wohlfahrtiimonas chitiniclastica]|uniref:DNA repair protein RadA n=1 Tax=Wohlfahrtiimonas chitiniclastica TaxID=400946 RepID=UPI000B98ED1E|nr:DNA repair protein RadA [Wohlfahrtiimonas chitiniclastica]OYQ69600.1 DNA repair protein RadA [Wohlfahrtiimonas chitiniclastica]OYQ81008.1 DNA repair protein RadA [Wohlfahrtiimonas chitiniclastica]
MSKTKKQYVCHACGNVTQKWAGQCLECQEWNTIEEAIVEKAPPTSARLSGYAGTAGSAAIQTLNNIQKEEHQRYDTGLTELNRVLGGGLVTGSVVLIGGDPGIGKSTILLQTMVHFSQHYDVLYVTGEESPSQIALRAERLSLAQSELKILSETSVEKIIATAEALTPKIMVIDSIQTIFTEFLTSAPGNVAQVRESAALLTRYAKRTNTAIFLVGHVTKEGAIAGPRVLEHMVDSVLYFEGEVGSRFRVMRAYKNRFGPVNELGIFAMTDKGLREVSNPSAIFLSRHDEPSAGSVIMVTKEGTRPLLVEIQALVDQSFGNYPRRVTLGIEQARLTMLLAVLHRHAGIAMNDQDVYVNAVGGVKVTETASDLAVIAATYSSFRNKVIPADLVIFGEVGLSGEIRPIPHGEERLKEAFKHGFTKAILPKGNAPRKIPEGLKVVSVTKLSEVIDALNDFSE